MQVLFDEKVVSISPHGGPGQDVVETNEVVLLVLLVVRDVVGEVVMMTVTDVV